jgi:hypothetical protein
MNTWYRLGGRLALGIALASASSAFAHVDPPDCSGTGVALQLNIFRADGVTAVVGPVSQCENINYQVILTKSSDGACAFSGGTLTLTLPDGTNDVLSSDVPCIGGTTSPCSAAVQDFTSPIIPYTIKPTDISAGVIHTTGTYANGFAHDNDPDSPGSGAITPKTNAAVLCTDNNACTNDFCDATKAGAAACSHTDVVCEDNNACTTNVCDPTTGICSFPPTGIDCNDNNACTVDSCNTTTGTCDHVDNVTSTCDDGNACTVDSCNTTTGLCQHIDNVTSTCNDGNACTVDSCNTTTGLCQHVDNVTPTCDDGNACTADSCNTTTGLCQHGAPPSCDDNNACTEDSCDPATGNCQHTNPPSCDDNNACTVDSCNTQTGACDHVDNVTPTCNDNNSCTVDSCNKTTGACQNIDTGTPACNDNDPCTDDSCDGSGSTPQCVNTIISPTPPECAPTGCRITGGGIVGPGGDETQGFAEIAKGTFGGQVGAPCGCIGCFGNDFDRIQGSWEYSRKGRKGNFHAKQFDSLVCGCDDGSGNPIALDGKLCGNRVIGPTPPAAPANVACFAGIGEISPENLGKRTQIVAYRVQVEDRGEPGAGKNSGPLDDVMHIRIWVPGQGETAAGLATAACCLTSEADLPNVIRAPDIDDGGTLTHGNIQIHPELPKTLQGICPPPAGSCAQE